MTDNRATAAMIGGITLLERAINYTLGSLVIVTPEDFAHPTPCAGWDLRALLDHMNDSLLALNDPVATLRSRARKLLGAWTNADLHQAISIAGCPVTMGLVTGTGAIEVAVHGWDVAQACGRDRPIPPSLAEEMLDLSPLFVTEADRPVRFAARVDVPPLAAPGDRLLAFLGRDPYHAVPDGAVSGLARPA